MGIAFREKALVKLRSPEQLDEPLRVIWQKKRLAYRTFLIVVVLAITWGVFGRLPRTGRGQGILMAPNSVVPIQAQADGQIGEWLVKVGDQVKRGDVLGILEQPVIQRQLEQAEAKVRDVVAQQRILKLLRDGSSRLQKESLQRQRNEMTGRIRYLSDYIKRSRDLAAQINKYNEQLLAIQKGNAATATKTAEQLTEELKQRVESYERLKAENLASDDTLRAMRMRFENSQLRRKELDLQDLRLNLSRVQTDQTYLDAQMLVATYEHTVTQLNLQLQGLDATQAQLDKLDSEAQIRDQNDLDMLNRSIERYRQQLSEDREIKSEYDGRVLELTAVEGNVVSFGQRLIQLDTRQIGQQLMAMAYFQADIGKYLVPGMEVRVSPSTVDQKRYGSIRGVVDSVSEYPITLEAVVNAIGNQQVATQLTDGGFEIEASVRLVPEPKNPSGFAWTSQQGPEVEITSGTTTAVWVTYENRPPISFVMPKLREWSGLELSTQSN